MAGADARDSTAAAGAVEPLNARRDVRSGQTWSAPQAAKNAAIRAGVAAALFVLDRLPARALIAFGAGLGRVLALLLWPMRRQTERVLSQVLGPTANAPRLAAECLRAIPSNLALTLLLRRPGFRASDWVQVTNASLVTLRGALSAGRGVVFVSAHLGPFELLPAALAELGLPASIVVRESYDPKLDPVVDHHRTLRGIEVIHRGRQAAPLQIVRALRRGRMVGFLPDLPGRVPTVSVRLLGQQYRIAEGPHRIAARAGCAMVVGTLLPTSASRTSCFRLELREVPVPEDEDPAQRVADALNDAIQSAPAHWPWMAAKFPSLQNKLPGR